MRHNCSLVLGITVSLIPSISNAQIASPGDLDPSGRVYTEVVARVGAVGTNSAAIPGMAVYIVSVDGHRTTLRTTLGGTAATWLPRAQYRIVTPDPFQYQERMYSWDTIVAVRPGMSAVRLQLENARSRPVPVLEWKANETGARETITSGRVTRSLSHAGLAVNASISRNNEVIAAELTFVNRTSRNVDYAPQTFTLVEESPVHRTLEIWAPNSGAGLQPTLSAGRISPGQPVSGIVFFERDPKARDVVLRIPVTAVTFEIPFVLR